MIRITIYKDECALTSLEDEEGMAAAWIQFAQLNGYGITLEAV